MSCVTIISIVRLHFVLHINLTDPDIPWNLVQPAVWSIVEGNIAIVCGRLSIYPLPSFSTLCIVADSSLLACLPFLQPGLSKLTFGVFNRSLRTTRERWTIHGISVRATGDGPMIPVTVASPDECS